MDITALKKKGHNITIKGINAILKYNFTPELAEEWLCGPC